MTNLKIPNEYPDLQAYARGQNIKFWRKWGMSVAVMALVIGLFLPYLATAWFHWLMGGVLFLLLSVVSFLWLGGYRHVTDHGFEGVVEKLDCATGVEMDSHTILRLHRTCPGCRHQAVDQYRVNRCTFFVRTDDGNLVVYKVHYWGFTTEIPVEVGDRIIKYRGLPYPMVLGRKHDLCIVCGRINEGDVDGTCSVCGHTLIK